jgi:hypothetical protein
MTRTVSTTAVLAALALAGCGGGDDKPAPAKQDKPAASTPYGTYVRDLTTADLKRTNQARNATGQERGSDQDLPPTGTLRLVLAKSPAGDVIKLTDPTDFTVPMYVKAHDGVLSLDDYVDPSKGAFCGPEIAVQWDYRFELDGDTLHIQASPPDECADRDSMLAGTWTKG